MEFLLGRTFLLIARAPPLSLSKPGVFAGIPGRWSCEVSFDFEAKFAPAFGAFFTPNLLSLYMTMSSSMNSVLLKTFWASRFGNFSHFFDWELCSGARLGPDVVYGSGWSRTAGCGIGALHLSLFLSRSVRFLICRSSSAFLFLENDLDANGDGDLSICGLNGACPRLSLDRSCSCFLKNFSAIETLFYCLLASNLYGYGLLMLPESDSTILAYWMPPAECFSAPLIYDPAIACVLTGPSLDVSKALLLPRI